MSRTPMPLPDACRMALEAIQSDPLNLPTSVENHLGSCIACSEARVQWLAMEDSENVLTPAGYFETLPNRVLRKLPARPVQRLHAQPILWAAAAALILAAGLGGFWFGRTSPQPSVVASATPDTEILEALPEAPFNDADDTLTQLGSLSSEESKAVVKQLATQQARRNPKGTKP